jgi:hypothetical protein
VTLLAVEVAAEEVVVEAAVGVLGHDLEEWDEMNWGYTESRANAQGGEGES